MAAAFSEVYFFNHLIITGIGIGLVAVLTILRFLHGYKKLLDRQPRSNACGRRTREGTLIDPLTKPSLDNLFTTN